MTGLAVAYSRDGSGSLEQARSGHRLWPPSTKAGTDRSGKTTLLRTFADPEALIDFYR